MGTQAYLVKWLRRKYRVIQQIKKKASPRIQSFFEEPVICKADFPSTFFDHIYQPITLITV